MQPLIIDGTKLNVVTVTPLSADGSRALLHLENGTLAVLVAFDITANRPRLSLRNPEIHDYRSQDV